MVILLIIVLFSILILAHELGHFLTARKIGAKVEEFGIGFPPRVAVAWWDKDMGRFRVCPGWRWKAEHQTHTTQIRNQHKEGTVYSLNLIPVGGFVKIYGEEGGAREDPKSFAAQSPAKRTLMLTGGVIMNFILAAVFLSVVSGLGAPQVVGEEGVFPQAKILEEKIQIINVAKGSPAFKAGIKPGDVLVTMRGSTKTFSPQKIKQVQAFTKTYAGQEITLKIKRGQEQISKTLVPRKHPPSGQGPMGVALIKTAIVKYPWYVAPVRGVVEAGRLSWGFVKMFGILLKTLIVKGKMIGQLAGPVGIFSLSKQAAKLGWNYLLNFGAIISVNLAIINILPFPALDGGRLLFVLIEKIKGSPVSQRVEQMVHQVGFAILILLIILITFRDVQRLL